MSPASRTASVPLPIAKPTSARRSAGESLTPSPVMPTTRFIVIGTPYCARIHPGFAAYLTVSDHESMTHRITQFASHIAVQYVLDSLYSSYFAKDYARCSEFLERSFPYTRLPGLK